MLGTSAYDHGLQGMVDFNVLLFGAFGHVEGHLLATSLGLPTWATLVTLLPRPVVAWAYHRLVSREEREMVERFGTDYADYRRVVPAYLPRRRDRTTHPAAADARHSLNRRRTTAKGDDPWNG